MKIGIALAAYQPEPQAFEAQLKSFLNQTHQNWHCIIQADSELNLPSWALQDSRFTLVQNTVRLGAMRNFEAALKTALEVPGIEAIAFSDQDDIWLPEKLSLSMNKLKSCPPLSLVHCDMWIDESKTQTAWACERRGVHRTAPHELIVRNVVAGAATLMHLDLARKYATIPPGLPWHDHWFALVASLHGGVHSLNTPLYVYRQHGRNLLGVTPWSGTLKGLTSVSGLLSKVCEKFNWSRNLWKIMKDLLPDTHPSKHILKRTFDSKDWGWSWLLWASEVHRDDPALARACLARGMGKALLQLQGRVG